MSIKLVNPVTTVTRVSPQEPVVYDAVNRSMRGQKEPKEEKGFKEAIVTRQDAENLAGVMNQISEMFNRSLQFKVYDDTNRLYVQIIDKETQEVIKQIPPQEMLELSAKIREMVGVLFDECV